MFKSIRALFTRKPALTAEQAYAASVRESRQWYLNEHGLPVRRPNASWFTVDEGSVVIDAPVAHVSGQIATFNHPAVKPEVQA